MAKVTENYGLTKPELSDFYDIEKFNENMDKIDEQLKELDSSYANTKTALVDADTIPLNDSAASNKLKRIPWVNIKNILANIFAGKSHASDHRTGGSDAISPSDIGAVPTSRTINGKSLNSDINLSASDVGLGNVPNLSANDQTVTFTRETVLQNLSSGSKLSKVLGQLDLLNNRYLNHIAVSNPHNVTAEQVGAAPAYTYGTTDLTAGSSKLETGKLYFVYE